jgi:16S rRNA processing protein RimM
MTTGPRLLLARIGAAHGVRGEVRVKAFTGDPLALGAYGPLLTEDGRTLTVERLRPDKTLVVVKFRGVDDRNAAESLRGLRLFVDRAALPAPEDEDEFYHADLIGLEAVAADGAPLGTVVAVHDFGAGDILDIAPPASADRGRSLLVPFTRACVPEIDLAAGRIVVAPPEEAASDEEGEG